MGESELAEHVRANRSYWDDRADEWVEAGERGWRDQIPHWGCWQLPDTEVSLLPTDMSGMRAIELGCGTGYVSAWMARRGASVVGIDNSERQLATARRLASDHGIDLTLHHGNAESVPYDDESFDFAVSEYGAAIWCDPALWIPEAHRLLKPGGELAFLGNTPLAGMCMPPSGDVCEPQLHRSYRDLGRIDWREVEIEPGGIEFNLPVSAWFKLFRETGFEVIDYLELLAPTGSEDRYSTPGGWAERWPAEQIWKVRKLGGGVSVA
jgi:SAM-dependent methyltransferase